MRVVFNRIYTFFIIVALLEVVFTEDIGFIYEDAADVLKDDIEKYIDKGDKGYDLKTGNIKHLSATNLDTLNATVSQIARQGIRYIYGHLPSFELDKLNEVGAANGVTLVVPQSDSSRLCLENVIYGYDRCHSAYSCRYRMNIIVGESNECNAKLIKFVSQFGSVSSYSFLEDYNEDNLKANLEAIAGNMTLANITLSIAVYNMYEFKEEIITIYQEAFSAFENKLLVNFVFEVKDMDTYKTYNDLDGSVVFVGEELNNNENLKNAMEENFGKTGPFTSVEVEFYGLLELLSQKLIELIGATLEQLRYALFNKEVNANGLKITMLPDHRVISPLYYAYFGTPPTVDPSTTTVPPTTPSGGGGSGGNPRLLQGSGNVWIYTELDIGNTMPTSQVYGQPDNTTCDLFTSNDFIPLEGFFMVLSFYGGDNPRGYYESFTLNAAIAAVKDINRYYGGLLGKSIVPIFLDGSLSDHDYMDLLNDYYERFDISIFYISLSIADIILINELFNKTVIYINIQATGGEFCEGNIMTGAIPNSAYFQRSVFTLLTQYPNVFVVYSNDRLGIDTKNAIEEVRNSIKNLNIVKSELMVGTNIVNGENVLSKINDACNEYESCIIVLAVEFIYLKPFFIAYSNSQMKNITRYPTLSFALNEVLIDEIVKETNTSMEGHYIMGYYFDSVAENDEKRYFRNNITALYAGYDNLKFTSQMALSFSNVYLMKNAIELVYTDDYSSLKSVFGNIKFDGPGGILQWTSDGFASGAVKLGIVRSDGTIGIQDLATYIEPTHSFIDLSRECKWQSSLDTTRQVYKIVYLTIFTDSSDLYAYSYNQYFSLVVAIMNDDYNGIDGRYLKAVKPLLRSIEEMIEYVQEVGNDPEVIAFMGTSNNEERERIHPYLLQYNKLLFSVYAVEGEQSYQNIIQFGRMPHHYMNKVFGYHYTNYKQCVVIAEYNKKNEKIIDYIMALSGDIETLSCKFNYTNSTDDIDDFIGKIKDEYPDGVAIYSLVRMYTRYFLSELFKNNVTSDKYPVTMLDIVEPMLTKYPYNSSEIEGQYFVTAFTYLYDSDSNIAWNNFLRTKYGEPIYLSVEASYAMYCALRFLGTAIESSGSTDSSTVRLEMYRTTIDLPLGKTKVTRKNMAIIGSFLMRCKPNLQFEIVLSITALLDIAQYSALLSPDHKQRECDYSISNVTTAADLYTYALWIKPDAENLQFMLSYYQNVLNSDGGNSGRPYSMVKVYCNDELKLNESIKSDVSFIISQCGNSTNALYNDQLKELNKVMLSTQNEDAGICYSNIIQVGSSPAQRTVPMIQYLIDRYSTQYVVFMPKGFKTTIEYTLLKDSIESQNGVIEYEVIVDESSLDQAVLNLTIRDGLASIKRYMPSGGVILNYLKTDESFIVYEKYFEVMSVYYEGSEDTSEMAKKYPIVTPYLRVYQHLPLYLRKGHLARIYGFANEDTNEQINRFSRNILGEGVLTGEEASILICSFEAFISVVTAKSSKSFLELIQSSTLSTSFGNLRVDTDNYLLHQMYIVTTNDDDNIVVLTELYQEYPARTYREYFNTYSSYEVCNIANSNYNELVDTIPLLILVPLNGVYRMRGTDMLLSYLTTVDYLNEKERVHNRIYSTVIINAQYSADIVIENVRKAKSHYNTRVVFGVYSSEIRKAVAEELEKEDILQYYPVDYEGLECKRHIFYTGIPFGVKTAVVPIISQDYGSAVYIVYTDTLMNQQIAATIMQLFHDRGVTVVNSVEIPMTGYTMSSILSIITSEFSSGAIISLLDGQTGIDFMQELYNEKYTYETYRVFNLLFRHMDVMNHLEIFDGHYYWQSFYEISEELFNETNIFNQISKNSYSHYSEIAELVPSCVLSILLNHYAMKSVKWNDTDKIGYTFDDLLNAIHSATIDEFPYVKPAASNHLTSSIAMYEVKDRQLIRHYQYINPAASNPYNTRLDYTGSNYCIFSNGLNIEKAPLNTYLIALLFSISGSLRDFEYTAIEASISIVNEQNRKGGINGKYVDYRIYDTESTAEGGRKAALQAVNDGADVFVGCFLNGCRLSATDELAKYNKTLWYPGVYDGQECNRSTYYTGLIPNQFMDQMISYITGKSYTPALYLVGDSGTYGKFIYNITQVKIGNSFELFSSYGSTPLEIQEIVIDIVTKMPNGGTIISTFSESEFGVFLPLLESSVFVENSYQLIIMNIDITAIKGMDHTGVVDVIMIGSYFDTYIEDNNFYKAVFNEAGRTYNTMFAESASIALDLWAAGVAKLNLTANAKIDEMELEKALFNLEVDSGSGKVKMNTNHHTSLYTLMARWLRNSHDIEIVFSQSLYQDPMAWNWDVPETNGLVCDYSNPDIGAKNKVIALNILVAISQSGVQKDTDTGLSSVIELAVSDINSKTGGLLNKKLYLTTVDIASNDEICKSIIESTLKQKDYEVIFTTASNKCLNYVLNLHETLYIPVFFIGFAQGEICVKQIIYSSREPSILDRAIDIYLKYDDELTMRYVTVGNDEFYSVEGMKYAEKYVEFRGGSCDNDKITNFKIETTDFKSIVTYIKSTFPDGVTILFFGTVTNHIDFDKALADNDMSVNKYPIISYATGENMIGTGVRDFFTLQTYFTSIDTTVSKNFVEMVHAYTKETISELMEDTFAVFNIWAESVTAVNSTNSTILMPGLYNRPYDSPEGMIYINTNNYLSHFFCLGRLNSNGNRIDIYYQSSVPIQPNPYKKFVNDGVYICDFTKDSVGSKKKDLTVTIGVFVSQSGNNKDTERAMFYGMTQAIREINENGGVLGRKIQVEVVDPKSTLAEYERYAIHFGELDEIRAVFGAGRYENLVLLADIFSQYNKPYFYPGLSAGNICNGFTFATQITTNQFSIAIKKYVAEKFSNYVIIDIKRQEFSKLTSESIYYTLLDMNVNIYGPVDYEKNITELTDLLTTIDLKNTAIIIAVIIDSNAEIFEYLCSQGITGSNAHIYSTSLNINVVKKIENTCIKGAYTFSSFIKEMGEETSDRMTYQSFSKSFVSLLKNAYGNDVVISPATEASYTAVKLWAEIVQNTYSFEAIQIRNSLYGYSFSSPAGALEVNTNGFTNRVVYLVQIGEDSKLSVIDYSSQPEEALAYDTAYPENKEVTCDLTVSEMKQNVSSIKVIFLHEAGYSEREIPVLLEEDARVKDLNYNKVNGYQVVPVVIFASDEADFDAKLKVYENDTSVVAYIGCRSIGCRNAALKYAEKQKKLFLNLGSTEGNYCSESIINVGTTAYQKISIATDYCHDNGVDLFYFIGDNSEESEAEYEMASAYVKEKFGFNMRSTLIEIDPITEDEVKRTIVRVTTVAEDNEVAIFFALKGDKAKAFLTYLKDDNLLTRSMKLIFISYSYYDYVGYDLSSFDSSYVAISFHPILTSSLAQSFISDTQKNIGYNQEITEEIESVKVAIDLWKTAMSSSYTDSKENIPPLNYLSINMVGQDLSIPSGTLKIETNGYATRSVYLLEINQNGELNQLYPYRGGATINKEARPYVNLPAKCKFGKSDQYFEYSVVLEALYFVFMAAGCVCSIASLIFTAWHQNQRIIRSFGRAYSYTMAVVLFACSLSAIPMGLPPSKDNNICMARPIALAICVKALLGVLLSKSTKIYTRTRRKINIELAKTRIPLIRVLGFMFSLVLVEIVVVVLWDLIDPNEYQETFSQKYSTYFEDIYIRECSTSTAFTVVELVTDGIICVYFLVISFKSRNAANRFNDSIGLFISACLLTVLGAVLVVLDFNINSEPDSVLIFRGLGVQIIVIILCITQFGIKMVNLFLNDEAGQQSESGSACQHGANASTFSTSKMSQSNSVFHSTTMHTRTYMTGMTTFTTHDPK